MINAKQLKDDLVAELKALEQDLRTRIGETPALRADLEQEWNAARAANRCAETFDTWAEQVITQAGVHWLLACVFLRFIEDNQLIERPWLAGTRDSGRRALAEDRHEAYFREHPEQSDRDYLLAAFRDCAELPGLATFFDDTHNPLFRLEISGIAAMRLRAFWLALSPDTGRLLRDFTDENWDTRFLGDLYQDLSEATRKRYALLQTPEFVEEFILDRTLTPAIAEVGWHEVRLIDPTCGSGHFLLGAFRRIVEQGFNEAPGINAGGLAQIALDAVTGVDLNPFAVAIARFRLMVAALQVAGVKQLKHAPNFSFNLAIGDSLLHGSRFDLSETVDMFATRDHYDGTVLEHAYASEDLWEANRLLGRQYHAVVGNPPYIVVKDAALNAAYRSRYASCHRQYSLGCPFTERFFELAITGTADGRTPAGHVGLITANSFMKREFGAKLIEQVLPKLDLSHVIDTSGAYIPGHGTPTVILFGRHRRPVSGAVRTVMGIKGEPSTPDDPAQGQVWTAILRQVDEGGSESAFVSVVDMSRATFGKHPWSIGGGGAAELREELDSSCIKTLGDVTEDMGFSIVTREDDAYLAPRSALIRLGILPESIKPMVEGDVVRDWSIGGDEVALWPYSPAALEARIDGAAVRMLWPARTSLARRVAFGNTQIERGLTWFEYSMVFRHRLKTPLTITFAEIATHNHFVLDRGGKVFKQTAPVIKLPASATEDDHLGLLGLLNSSVACFWLKQVCQKKGAHLAGKRTREERYAFNATNVADFPLPVDRPLAISRRLDALAQKISSLLPAALLARNTDSTATSGLVVPTRAALDAVRTEAARLRAQAIAAQEELDWQVYALYGLLDGAQAAELRLPDGVEPPEVHLGERAFEIVLARRIAAGTEQTTWFERHGSTPVTDIPAHWPAAYRTVVERRIALIEADRNIGLIERPEYKRRWNSPDWQQLELAALRSALLDHLEAPALWPATDTDPPQLTTTAKLADRLTQDPAFQQLAALYTGRNDPDLPALVATLVQAESVPFLPAQRYTESGLRKRADWQATWVLQRREDAGEDIGHIPVPPKYEATDFQKKIVWELRGGLDVPKERFVSYPGCERSADPSPVIAWAGWNPLQQATALAGYYFDMKENEGWEADRLIPLLAGLDELVPWLKQWHNDLDPTTGERLGDYYEAFTADEAKSLGLTPTDLRAWKPAVTAVRRGRKAKAQA